MDTRRRLPFLDALRAIAVVFVLGRHMIAPAADVSIVLKSAAMLRIRIGWIGVDLFFALSGFLVAGLLFTEYQQRGSVDVIRFLVRSGFKIYPGFYVMLVVTVLVVFLGGKWDPALTRQLLVEIFYLQSYMVGLWNHTWSLAVEEHFYVLLAVGMYAILAAQNEHRANDPFRRFLRLTSLIVLAISVGRLLSPFAASMTGAHLDATRLRIDTHGRIDTLLIGVILSYVYHFHRMTFLAIARRHRWLITVGSALLLLPPFLWPLDQSAVTPSIGLLCIALGFAGVITGGLVASGDGPTRHPVLNRVTIATASIGFHSYSIYLWHMPVQSMLTLMLALLIGAGLLRNVVTPDVAFVVNTLLYFMTAVLVGVAIGKLIEQPALSLRDRLFPSRSSGRLTDRSTVSNRGEDWASVAAPKR